MKITYTRDEINAIIEDHIATQLDLKNELKVTFKVGNLDILENMYVEVDVLPKAKAPTIPPGVLPRFLNVQ